MNFDKLESRAIANGNYDDLPLDDNNDMTLTLLSDGITAIVMRRENGSWIEIDRFIRDTHFTGGHWSDCDIARAINGPF